MRGTLFFMVVGLFAGGSGAEAANPLVHRARPPRNVSIRSWADTRGVVSPDGRFIAYVRRGLAIEHTQTGRIRRRVKVRRVGKLKWSPDSRSVAFNSRDYRRSRSTLYRYHVRSGRLQRVKVTSRYIHDFSFTPRGGGQQQPELAVSAALGLMDVWTVMENSMQNLLGDPRNRWSGHGWPDDRIYAHTYKTWYALADCGLRIPIAAGTSYGRLSRLGFNRVYARVDGELTTASWAAALVRGDGFVTNGPLLWLRVDDRLPGDGLALDAPGRVKVNVQLVSHRPVRLVEILQNGRVVASRELTTDGPNQELEWEEVLPVGKPCWFAARCFGEADVRYPHQACPNQFAHTDILMVTVAGKKPTNAASAAQFIDEIDALIEFAPNIPSDAMQQRALKSYNEARRYYAAQAGSPTKNNEDGVVTKEEHTEFRSSRNR